MSKLRKKKNKLGLSWAKLRSDLAWFWLAWLLHPHPVLWTAGSNPYEVSKAVVQCKMLSGRYRSELLSKNWSSNTRGFCLAPTCTEVEETLEHILLSCPSYQVTRERLLKLWQSAPVPAVAQVVDSVLIGGKDDLLQFLLDPSTNPSIIKLTQDFCPEPLKVTFHLTRTWCFALHKSRAKLLGRWSL